MNSSYLGKRQVETYADVYNLEVLTAEVNCMVYCSGLSYRGLYECFEVLILDGVEKSIKSLANLTGQEAGRHDWVR